MEDKLDLTLRQRITKFQREEIEIIKSEQAHKYKYASLDNIMGTIMPYLKDCGIGYEHNTGYNESIGKHYVKTILYNIDDVKDEVSSITYIDEETKLATMNKFMVLGAAMTYFRRYHLALMLGLLTDEDTDAGGASTSGRSVDSSPSSSTEVDYLSIFKNQIDKGKTKVQMEKIYKIHEPNMTESVSMEIIGLIDKLK